MILELPNMIYMNTFLDKILKKISQLESGDEVSLSFKSVNFILPESTILLLSISKQIYDRTNMVVTWIDVQNDMRMYLERIQINNLPFINFSQKSPLWEKRTTNTLVEMKIMSRPNQCDEMISDTKKILYEWFPERHPDQYVKQISEYIRHIAGNSLEHSEEDQNGICYYTLQKYSPPGKKLSVRVAFGDTGMGIGQSLGKTYPWIAGSNKNPLICAFIDGLSCRGNKNGGLGFRIVKQHLHTYGGEIQIRSGNTMLRYYGKNENYKIVKFKYPVIGTQTLFILN